MKPAIAIFPVRLEAPDGAAARFERTLAPEEIARADRFRTPELRRRFVLARGALRLLLGRELRVSAESIAFTYGPKGKPAINGVDFNASHSGDLALYAITHGCALGIDIERHRPLPDLCHIAERFFCPEETEALLSLPPLQREHAFFLCWTRKEAYIKATGDGLSLPLDSFRVALAPDAPARMIHLGHDCAAAESWQLHNLEIAAGYAAALAYRDDPRALEISPILAPDGLLV